MTNEELSAKVAELRGDKCVHRSKSGKCGLTADEEKCVQKLGCLWFKPYATDMNAAWELVQEFVNQGNPWVDFDHSSARSIVKAYEQGTVDPFKGKSSTMPRAICKAYLSWRKSCN